MDPDSGDQPIAQAHGMSDDIQMAVGNGVEGARIKSDTGHKPPSTLLRATPQAAPGSRLRGKLDGFIFY